MTRKITLLTAALLSASMASADDGCDDACQAARNAQDPLAPVTAIMTDNTATESGTQFQLQPVHTIKGDNGNLILRGVVPLQFGKDAGVGDVVLQAFYVPGNQTGFKFGFGPQISLKTRTHESIAGLGNAIGAAAVGFGFAGNWSYGGIVSHMVNEQNTSVTSFQPIVFYNLPSAEGVYVGYNNTISYTDNGPAATNGWNVPVGVSIGKTMVQGNGGAVDASIGAYAVYRDALGDWDGQIKFSINYFFGN
ncbi:hypothetical protein BXY66_2991 [Shimia isoporae]|uniref:Outer membrane beta-barrel porin/alpha-amylase n=1 Tax=Shimia isoporae TaxID=647720 RepID=A0A4R1N1W3_9RHOB|nr:hypothetical protein [Shimia isoporae]TCL00350.1 hypothetical protein BXY66_2991 [Shimia isoporae]